MAQGIKHDYEPIRSVYVEGAVGDDGLIWPSLHELADQFGVSYGYLRRKAAQERWVDERAAFQRMLDVQRREQRLRELTETSTHFDGAAINTARLGLNIVGQRLAQLAAESTPLERRTPQQNADFPPDKYPYHPLSAKEMSALASAAFKWQTVGKRGLGEVEGTSRVEHTGGGGGPIERVDVRAVLSQPDPDRFSAFFTAAIEAGLLDDFDPEQEVIDVDGRDAGPADEGPLPEAAD